MNDVGSVVAKFGAREKGKATKHASALTRGKAPTATVSPDIADPFGLHAMPGLTVAPPLSAIPLPESPSCPTSVANIASATEKEAAALQELSQSLWGSTEAPALLDRAGKLLRHAEALVKSPLCSGKEQKMAWEDLRRGADAYTQARDAIARGEKPDIVTTLRRIAERVSLAAARAAKSCSAGQQKIGKARALRATRSRRDLGARDAGPRPSRCQPVWPPAAAPPRRCRRHRRPPRPRKAKAPEVDPAKDQALVERLRRRHQAGGAQLGGGA